MTTVLAPCPHGRRRPHAWRCEHEADDVAHACAPDWVPAGTSVIVRNGVGGLVVECRLTGDLSTLVEFCRCSGGHIVELADGTWAHLDPTLAAGCLDTHPVEDLR